MSEQSSSAAASSARGVVFVDGIRTPFGKAGPKGMYADTRADDLVRCHPFDVFRREITIRGSFAEMTSFGAAIDALRGGRVRTNGLITQGYSTFNSLPGFPLIGGAPTVKGWNSPNCGKCYQLHYKNGNVDETINMLAVDSAPGGFNLGLEAMNRLTKGNAEQLGRIHGTYTEVDKTQCGL